MERLRQLSEDIERFELAASEALLADSSSQKRRVGYQHVADEALRTMRRAAEEIKQIKENGGLPTASQNATEALAAFHQELEELKRDIPASEPISDMYGTSAKPPQVHFTGEESHGRHLDLHSFHQRFINLPFVGKPCKYRAFVNSFFKFEDAPGKLTEQYHGYVVDLCEYLVSFLQRAQPLVDVQLITATIDEQTEAQWASGERRRWDTAVERPLHCVECAREFTKETVLAAHKQSKRHAAALKRYARDSEQREAMQKRVFFAETRIERLADLLQDTVRQTTINIDKKLARTLREQIQAMQEESDESNEGSEDEEEDEEAQVVRSIKNYPVGWDGEPIPYWLYRLHGLGVDYKCEICGNVSYWGRRPFEKHFTEQRHQNALKLLQIPYRPELFDVTRIRDAIDLYKKLLSEEAAIRFNPELDVEMEDASGKVYDLKTYILMSKQGLIK